MRDLLLKLCSVLLLVALAGCGSGGTSTSGGTGAITAKLEWSQGKSSSIWEILGIRPSTAPSGVVTVRIIVGGPDMANIQKDFPAADGKGVIGGVPAGSNRSVTAQGLNANGNVAYQGSKGGVNVVSGQTTDIGTITMLPFGTACLDLINQGKILEARDVCVGAADAFADTVSNEADTARFFAAFSRIASLWYNMSSDGNPGNGLQTFGDILDAFGCSASGRDPLNPKNVQCPKVLPSNAPTGAQLQVFVTTVMKPELDGAIGNLNKVSQSFTITWVEPFGGKQVLSDFGDALALRALSEYLLGAVIVENSYNLDDNIANTVNTKQTKQAFLAANPNFLKLTGSSELPTAQGSLGKASDDTISAIDWMQARTGSQGNYFINLGNQTPAQISNTKRNVNEFKVSLTGPSNLHENSGNFEATLNLTRFFAGMDLRNLLPAYSGNIPGFFPDPTFNGTWTNYTTGSKYDPNHDFNKDGVPDLLRKHLSSPLQAQGAGQKSKSLKKQRPLRG